MPSSNVSPLSAAAADANSAIRLATYQDNSAIQSLEKTSLRLSDNWMKDSQWFGLIVKLMTEQTSDR
jgi:hypothetical protein